MPSRRVVLATAPLTFLAAAAAAVGGVEDGILPGRTRLDDALGLEGRDGVIPDVAVGAVIGGSFVSRARAGATTRWTLIRPPGSSGQLPLVVALHGRGGDHRSVVAELGVPQFLALAVAHGVPPFAVVGVDGGDTYWHPHHGTDSGAMVTDELLPAMAQQGVGTDRIGLYGWSMGGYGALRIAGILGPRRVAAVAVASPALWLNASDVSPAGFSTPAEYNAYSILHRQRSLTGIGVRIDIGRDDPFVAATRSYVHAFPAGARVVSTFPPGAHTDGFWRRMLPAELAFLGHALAAPR